MFYKQFNLIIFSTFLFLMGTSGYTALNGPIVDAYQRPFLYVYGTMSPNDYENNEIARTTKDVVDKWKTLRNRVVPVKKDIEVTEEDIQNYHLILYGNERSNKIIKQIGKDLPIRFNNEAIVVGDRKYSAYDNGAIFVAPNPLNRNKYVVIYGALTYHGFPYINAVKASDTDYIIFNRFTKDTRVDFKPNPPLEEGYFDKSDPYHWKVKPAIKTASGIAEETSYQPATPPSTNKK